MARTAHRTPGPPAAGRPDPAATRAAIVAATVRLVGRGGTALVTHRAVAAEAGVSLSSTTYHFASKDAIVDAALRSVAEREIERLAAAAAQLRDRGDVPEVIDATLDWLAAQLAEDDDVVRAGYHLQLETTRRPQLAEVHLAWARAVQRLAEEVLRAAGSPSPSWTRAWWPRRSTACASSSSRCRAGRTGSSPRDRCWSGSCAC